MTSVAPSALRVAYLLKRYPRLSETFILHEILELERQGMNIQLFSILDPEEPLVHPQVSEVRSVPRYLPRGWGCVRAVLRAHAALLRRAPRRYLSAAREVLMRRRRAAIKHFLRAGWLARELDRLGIDHLHAHFAHGPAAVAYLVHRLTGLSYSVTAHAKDIYTEPPSLLKTRLASARFVVTCTDYNSRYLEGIVGDGANTRIHRIYHGLDLRGIPAEKVEDGEATGTTRAILAVGRLVEKKGFPYLIDAIRLLTAAGYSLRLQVAGDGSMKDDLWRHAVEAGIADRVQLLGARAHAEIMDLYGAASIVVLPSIVTDSGDRDGIPNVLIEAMRVGRPVISTDVSGIPELVIHGETGLVVPPRDAPALAAAIARLLDNPLLVRHLTANAALHVTREFDLAANTARLKGLLTGMGAPAP